MPKDRPRCHCGGDTKCKGTTRRRCKACGVSVNKSRPDVTKAAALSQFIEHCISTTSLEALATQNGVSASTTKRRFSWCWLVDVLDLIVGHTGRIYDQVFIDGTYTASRCLIVAGTLDHVIACHWSKRETTHAYIQLLERISAPSIAVIDGEQGAASAIKQCWPTTVIQRCLVHAQRVIRRYTTSRPRTDAGCPIYQLAPKLTRITTIDQASQWGAQLNGFASVYRTWLEEKTLVKDPKQSIERIRWPMQTCARPTTAWRSDLLLVYLTPPEGVVDTHEYKPPPIVSKAESTPS